jgi:heme exporter protein C
MTVAMTLFFAALATMAMRNEIFRRRLRTLELGAAAAAASAAVAGAVMGAGARQ